MTNTPDLTPGGNNSEGTYLMGLTFHVTEDLSITGLRFYSPSTQTGTGGAVYALGGAVGGLAQEMQDFSAGWNTITFDTPVAVAANATEDHFAGVLLPNPSKYTNATTADPFTEGNVVFDTAGAYIAGATSLTLPVAAHKGGASDGGQVQWGGGNWFGLQLITDEVVVPLEPITFSAVRTNDTTATLTWGTLTDAPDGVTVLRATGEHAVDGDGDAFGEEGYDPTTISGATVIAENQTSPYVNTGLDAETTYTYAVIRTGPDA